MLDAQDARAGKILGEAQDVADVGAAPAVDGLILVADDAEIGLGAGQQAQQIVLHAVGVLIFVDVQIAEALLPGGARVVEAAQHFDGAQQQIVEIERAGLAQCLFVRFVDARVLAGAVVEGLGQRFFGRDGVIFGEADASRSDARGFVRIVDCRCEASASLSAACWSSAS